MSRDLFEEYGIEPPKNKKRESIASNKPRDVFEEEGIYYPEESKGLKGIASDAYNTAIQAVLGIPGAIMDIPGEVYGAGKQIIKEPKRALQNVGAGFGELGHGILSAPGNIRDYLSKKGFESENSWRLPESILPKEYNYAEALGAEGEHAGDALLRGLPAGAALSPLGELMPGVSSAIGKGFGKLKPENPYHFIQKSYDVKEKSLSDAFKHVSKEANKAGVKVELPKNIVNEVIESGPKTDRFIEFVNKAKSGDYDSLRKLQTELFKRGKKYASSPFGSDTDFAEHLFEQRDKINKAIVKSLENHKRPDLASKLTETREGWRNLEDLYHSNPTISKLVGQEREVPFTYKPLRKESSYMKQLKEEHPEIEKKLANSRRAKQATTIAGLLGLGKFGIDKFTGNGS